MTPRYDNRIIRRYSARALSRLPCAVVGCNSRAYNQMQIDANGPGFIPLCKGHDVEINLMLMRKIFGFSPESEAKTGAYVEKVLG